MVKTIETETKPISTSPKPVDKPQPEVSEAKPVKSILDPDEEELKATKVPLKVESKKDKIPEKREKETSQSSHPLLIIGIVTGIVILVAGGIFLVFSFKSRSQEAVGGSEIVEAIPTPKEGPTLERGEITFEVLNGSDIQGLAKTGAEKLKTLGYKIGKTGNYSGEVKENEVYLSGDLMDKKDLILKDLGTDFKISTVSGELKNATSSGRIILIEKLP